MISNLILRNIRIYPASSLEIGPGITAFYGPNASGKSTLLEAICVLSTLHSFRTQRLVDLLRVGAELGTIEGIVGEAKHSREVQIKPRSRLLRIDRKPVAKAIDFCRAFRVVTLAPEHHALFDEGPTERRRFVDRLLSTIHPSYFGLYSRFHRALKHKQALLRQELSQSMFIEQVDPWNQELALTGEEIRVRRIQILDELLPYAQQFHQQIAPIKEISLQYKTSSESLAKDLEKMKLREYFACRTLVGPHLDDVQIDLEGQPAEKTASQGERASILVALKLGELKLVEQSEGSPPTLLLDDLGATLDVERRNKLLQELSEKTYQTLVTSSDETVAKAALEAGGRASRKEKLEGFSVAYARWA